MPLGKIVPQQYLELHIEQGPVLESTNIDIGAVANLQGISWQQLTIKGKANHAGTTPMHLRQDAGFVAAAISTFVRELTKNTNTLATIGSLNIEPNVINVIPNFAQMTIDLRNPNEAELQLAEKALADYLNEIANSENVSIEAKQLARFEPVIFAEELVKIIEESAKNKGVSYQRMTSGAGHDAQMIARIAPAAMIFVPSKDGISHNPQEHTEPQQLISGAEILLDSVKQILLQH